MSDKSHSVDSSLGRRSFLTRSALFGAGVGLLGSTASASAANAAVECQASAADSLVMYVDLLRNVESEAFVEAATMIDTAATSCYKTLDTLYEKVKLLQTELRRTQAQSKVQEMRDAVEVGRAHVDAVRTSFAHARGASTDLGKTLNFVREQVGRAAQEIMPPGKITLSPKAKKLLEDMIAIVRDSHDVPQQTQQAVGKHEQRVAEVSEIANSIRDDLFAASSAAADADFSNSSGNAQAASARAATNIDSACAKLEKLRTKPGTRRVELPGGLMAADLLIKVLQGTKQSLGSLNASLTEKGRGVQMLPAGFVNPSLSMPSNYSRVQAALEMHCPRGTWLRTGICMGLLLGPLGVPDRAARIPLISGVLVLFPCPNGNRAALASALATI